MMTSSGIEARSKGVEIEGMEKEYGKFVGVAVALKATYLVTETIAHLSKFYEIELGGQKRAKVIFGYRD